MSSEFNYILDDEEQDILEKFERGEVNSPPGSADEMELARQAAKNTLASWQKVTLHVTGQEYKLAQSRAREAGMTCPDLLSQIIRNYLSGRLVEKS